MSPEATPRWRSSAPSARPARPRPWWRDSTQARANSSSSMSFTSAKRSSTFAAASSGTPRRRSASANCAFVRGAAESSRRQICLATASGSASCSAPTPSRLARPSLPRSRLRLPALPSRARRELPPRPAALLRSLVIGAAARARPIRLLRTEAADRGHALLGEVQAHTLLGLGVQPGTDAQLLLDLLLDLVGQIRVVAQEVPGVLLALTELVALVGVPGAGLAHDALLDAEVDEPAFTANPDSIQNVKFCDLEWRTYLVLHDLHAGPVSDGVSAVLQRLDPPNVQPDRRVELQRLPTGGGFGRSEHNTYFFPKLVDKDRRRLCLVECAGDLAERLRHQPGLQADVAVPHLALDLGLRHQGGDRVDDDDVDGAGADQHVRDFQCLLAGVRLGYQQRVDVDAKLLGILGIERVFRVDEGRNPA